MSQNAEARAKTEAANKVEWDALTDQQRTAIRAALKAYANAPGTSINIAMLRGVQAYQREMSET